MARVVRSIFPGSGGSVTDESLYGIEIEVERYMGCPEASYIEKYGWRVTGDGSLRNNGAEFISPPADIATLHEMVHVFYEWLEEYRYRVNVRTSTHVHANMLPNTLTEVGAVAATYALLEPILFQYCGAVREENIYCVPWYRTPAEAALVSRLITVEDSCARARAITNALCKYSSFYLGPLRNFGTVEFRSAPVFPTASALMQWIKMCAQIVDFGVEMGSAEEVLEEYLMRDAESFVERATGNDDLCTGQCEQLMEEADSIAVASLIVPQVTPSGAGSWDLV